MEPMASKGQTVVPNEALVRFHLFIPLRRMLRSFSYTNNTTMIKMFSFIDCRHYEFLNYIQSQGPIDKLWGPIESMSKAKSRELQNPLLNIWTSFLTDFAWEPLISSPSYWQPLLHSSHASKFFHLKYPRLQSSLSARSAMATLLTSFLGAT